MKDLNSLCRAQQRKAKKRVRRGEIAPCPDSRTEMEDEMINRHVLTSIKILCSDIPKGAVLQASRAMTCYSNSVHLVESCEVL